MRRIFDLRITHWGWKLAYVVAAYLLPMPGPTATAIGVSDAWFAVISAVWTIAAVLYGARVFRGRGEPVAPPRPWWQMTARPTLSRNLGLLLAVVTASSFLGMVLELAGVVEPRSTPVVSAVTMIEFGVLAYLYLNSAARLRRTEGAATTPTFQPSRDLTR
ncbi:hypothetical protein ACFVTX_11280 [Agromyces sp. NPDC058136]|uniref:hypothetical protein n=1 Tax=Agromyces sp. NPDC058136 TaxID=3346354 RepID=UPI0036DBAE55